MIRLLALLVCTSSCTVTAFSSMMSEYDYPALIHKLEYEQGMNVKNLNDDEQFRLFISMLRKKKSTYVKSLHEKIDIGTIYNPSTQDSALYYVLKYAFPVKMVRLFLKEKVINLNIDEDLGAYNGNPIHLMLKYVHAYFGTNIYIKKEKYHAIYEALWHQGHGSDGSRKKLTKRDLLTYNEIVHEKKKNILELTKYLLDREGCRILFPHKREVPKYYPEHGKVSYEWLDILEASRQYDQDLYQLIAARIWLQFEATDPPIPSVLQDVILAYLVVL